MYYTEKTVRLLEVSKVDGIHNFQQLSSQKEPHSEVFGFYSTGQVNS